MQKAAIVLVLCWIFSIVTCFAQHQVDLVTHNDSLHYVPKVDIFDIVRLVLGKVFGEKKGVGKPKTLNIESDTVLKNKFSILPVAQYTPATRIAIGGVLNSAFYTGAVANTHLSVIHSEVAYTMNRQFIFVNRSVIWTKGNKYNLVGDWRYDKYPSYTYGLGANSSINNKLLLDYHYIRFYQTIYKKVHPHLFLGVGYNLDYRFNIQQEVNDANTDFMLYSGGATRSVSSGVTFNILHDSRRNLNNPVGGAHYASIVFRQNLTALGSTANWQSLIVDARKYISFPAKSWNLLTFWTYNWFSFNGKTPYLDLPSTYWDSFENQGRGYIQGRFRGQNLISFETEYRFNLTRNRFLGGVVFSNVHSVSQMGSTRFNVFYPAVGTGIRIKINKYTNTNLAIDYAIGINGSDGIFINLGEVF